MMDSNFDYFQYKKINSLPSKSLRDYTLAAASYQFDADLQKLFESSGVLSEYESVFLGCGIPYNERVALIKKWIATIDISNFSVDTIEYPDPRMGDCMIPFPDRRNADKIIPGSFESNQQYARYLNNLKSGSVDPRINELKQEMQKLEKEYAVEIDKANSLISLGQVLE